MRQACHCHFESEPNHNACHADEYLESSRATLGHEDIRGFDVPVNDVSGGGGVDCIGDPECPDAERFLSPATLKTSSRAYRDSGLMNESELRPLDRGWSPHLKGIFHYLAPPVDFPTQLVRGCW